MKHALQQYYNISYNSTNNAGDVPQSYNISCKPTNNIGSVSGCTIEKLPHNNKYCFTITPINYYGSGMQLICKLLSFYCKQVWYFIGKCFSINKSQCENNNGDMSGGLSTGAIIGILIAVIIFVLAIIIGIYCAIRNRNEIQEKGRKMMKTIKDMTCEHFKRQ